MPSLKIGFESSVLFASKKGPLHRTGIYRYAYLLAQLIKDDPSLSLHFIRRFSPLTTTYDLIHLLSLSSHKMAIPSHYNELANTKVVVTVHDIYQWLFLEKVHSCSIPIKQMKSLFSNAFVMCPSLYTKNDLIKHFHHNPEQIFVTPLFASPNLFYPKYNKSILKKYRIPEKPYFLYVGRMDDRKGIDLLLRSFKKFVLEEKNQKVNLVLAGVCTSSTIQHVYYNEILLNKLNERVLIIGPPKDEDLNALYSQALAFTFLSEFEGFGYPLLEAMHCKTPTICFANSSIPEVVGKTAFYVKERTEESVCKTLLEVCQNEKERDKRALEGYERSQLFNPESFKKSVLEAYQKIAEFRLSRS